MFRDQIDQVLNGDPSELERAVLADYEIDDAEYRRAQAAYKACMEEHGVDVVVDADGEGYTLHDAEGGPVVDVDSMNFTCQEGTISAVEPLYLGMKSNPRGLTGAELMRECYREKGVPDGDGLSLAQFEEMVFADDYRASTPEGAACFWDPTGYDGITPEQAVEMDKNRVTKVIEEYPDADG
ncbi:MAG: hypothetical protein LBD90_09045 [Bifidobacteriaceae bacterium]|jgi:hypothetical protein|nr:hypothetical protein [Bifidobacteriaceae bacterium]